VAGGRPQFELELPFTSPYKRTRLFIKDGRAFFGIWRPLDVQMDGDEESVLIQRGLEGHLDLVSYVVYGDRRLWRVIAQVNRIDFPLEEVTVGRRILVPKPTNVRSALLASGVQVEVA
jgi:hypothetical protein